MTEIEEVYREDTIGRRYHTPTKSKKGTIHRDEPASEMVSLNLNSPMDKEEFKKLTDSLKVIYIQHLRKTFGCTSTQIAEMLGYSSCHFSRLMSNLNQKGLFKKEKEVKYMREKLQRFMIGRYGVDAFNKFLLHYKTSFPQRFIYLKLL